MIGTERLLVDLQRSFIEWLGLGVAALVVVESSQVEKRLCDITMVGTERFLANRQRSLIERLRIDVAALRQVERSEFVERCATSG
jgi:hypothetical protein